VHLSLAICDHCDTVHQRTQIPRGTRAHCHRCGGELYSNRTTDVTALLAFSLSALIVFVIANAFPIVVVELGGEQTQTTLLGAVATSYQSGMAAIAGLAAALVFLFPLLLILLSLYVFAPLHLRTEVPGLSRAMRALEAVRPWSMVEVFMMGVLVSLVKLSGDTEVHLAPGLWGFAFLTLLMTLLNGVDMQELWEIRGRRKL
tara:strand:+ start:3260 stop:3865 length:606 start_codon:yes stop_codon:yes gene_type:complete